LAAGKEMTTTPRTKDISTTDEEENLLYLQSLISTIVLAEDRAY
jgi:hypothetical protein